MRRRKTKSARPSEEGIVVLLVAIVLLFVVAAMAALAIDLVTLYTARSEAQQAADGAALAGARVLASSGMTSNPADTGLASSAENLAVTVALQVATQNRVGGRTLTGGAKCGPEICVSFNDGDASFGTNPQVTVQVNRADLPTFFARIWGKTAASVKATATAEAYNPSGVDKLDLDLPVTPIAPTCVKPWVLPNMSVAGRIFDEDTGAIRNPGLLGQAADSGNGGLRVTCSGDCAGQKAQLWRYFPGKQTSFPAPTKSLPACSVGLSAYQKSIAGCVQQPVLCGNNSGVDLDTASTATDADAEVAVDCLAHTLGDFGDKIDPTHTSGQPFQYVGGNANPVAGAQGANVMVSDSLVTAPVVDVDPGADYPANPVRVIGFVQFFLNPGGAHTPNDHVPATIINMAGCGKNASGQPILGNGASPVPVRLITPQ